MVLSCTGRGRETAIALTWRHAVGNCVAKWGGNHGRAHPDARCRDELPDFEHVLVRDRGYENWLAQQIAVDPDPAIDAEDYFIIRHTGGTTGKSKGVAYTHRAWLAAGRDGLYLCPPMMLNAINRIPGIERRKYPDLKCMMVSTAPISDETALKAYEILGDAMYQGYGQTEVLSVAMMGPRQWFAKDVAGSPLLRSSSGPMARCGASGTTRRRQGRWLGEDRPYRAARCERLSLHARSRRRHGDLGRLQHPSAERENVIAVVCVKPQAAVTEKELVELCSVHLGNDKRRGKVVLRHDPLAKPIGKIKHKGLREPFWVGRERRVAGN
jgi:acyl-CoA synthetase (AMP-forming)/AMP-acid ligase II